MQDMIAEWSRLCVVDRPVLLSSIPAPVMKLFGFWQRYDLCYEFTREKGLFTKQLREKD